MGIYRPGAQVPSPARRLVGGGRASFLSKKQNPRLSRLAAGCGLCGLCGLGGRWVVGCVVVDRRGGEITTRAGICFVSRCPVLVRGQQANQLITLQPCREAKR